MFASFENSLCYYDSPHAFSHGKQYRAVRLQAETRVTLTAPLRQLVQHIFVLRIAHVCISLMAIGAENSTIYIYVKERNPFDSMKTHVLQRTFSATGDSVNK